MNRRIRFRTYGGVRGREPVGSPLLDCIYGQFPKKHLKNRLKGYFLSASSDCEIPSWHIPWRCHGLLQYRPFGPGKGEKPVFPDWIVPYHLSSPESPSHKKKVIFFPKNRSMRAQILLQLPQLVHEIKLVALERRRLLIARHSIRHRRRLCHQQFLPPHHPMRSL